MYARVLALRCEPSGEQIVAKLLDVDRVSTTSLFDKYPYRELEMIRARVATNIYFWLRLSLILVNQLPILIARANVAGTYVHGSSSNRRSSRFTRDPRVPLMPSYATISFLRRDNGNPELDANRRKVGCLVRAPQVRHAERV